MSAKNIDIYKFDARIYNRKVSIMTGHVQRTFYHYIVLRNRKFFFLLNQRLVVSLTSLISRFSSLKNETIGG